MNVINGMFYMVNRRDYHLIFKYIINKTTVQYCKRIMLLRIHVFHPIIY